MILVPMDAPGVNVVRALTVFGYDDAPHGHAEIDFADVRVPVANVLLGEGARLRNRSRPARPGTHPPLHAADRRRRARARSDVRRVRRRVAFGKPLAEQGVVMQWIADSRIEIDQARLLTLARRREDGPARATKPRAREIAMIKVVAPNVAQRVVDRAIQAHGGAGVTDDFGLAHAWAAARTLRIADGPDEVHRAAIAKDELARQATLGEA